MIIELSLETYMVSDAWLYPLRGGNVFEFFLGMNIGIVCLHWIFITYAIEWRPTRYVILHGSLWILSMLNLSYVNGLMSL